MIMYWYYMSAQTMLHSNYYNYVSIWLFPALLMRVKYSNLWNELELSHFNLQQNWRSKNFVGILLPGSYLPQFRRWFHSQYRSRSSLHEAGEYIVCAVADVTGHSLNWVPGSTFPALLFMCNIQFVTSPKSILYGWWYQRWLRRRQPRSFSHYHGENSKHLVN